MIKEIFAKEYWLPYAELVILSLWWFNTAVVESWLLNIGLPYPSFIIGAIGGLILIGLIVAPARHDQSLETRKRDERELQQELEVSHVAYQVAVIGIGTYVLLWTFDPILLGLLALILASRLYKRIQLEQI